MAAPVTHKEKAVMIIQPSLVSRGTQIADLRFPLFNKFREFNPNVMGLKSQIGVLKWQTKCSLNFVRN